MKSRGIRQLLEPKHWIHCGMTWKWKLDVRSRCWTLLVAQSPMIKTRHTEEDGDEYGIFGG